MPYPGLRAVPTGSTQRRSSAASYKVLRGGSWATRPGAIRKTPFRNWDYPIRRPDLQRLQVLLAMTSSIHPKWARTCSRGPSGTPVPRMLAEGGCRAGGSAEGASHPKYFYDHRGSEPFEEITRLPEHYPTRTERALLEVWMPTAHPRTRDRASSSWGPEARRRAGSSWSAMRSPGARRACTSPST